LESSNISLAHSLLYFLTSSETIWLLEPLSYNCIAHNCSPKPIQRTFIDTAFVMADPDPESFVPRSTSSTMLTGLFMGVILGAVLFIFSFYTFDKHIRPKYFPNLPSLNDDYELPTTARRARQAVHEHSP
jgi:hypothetical protein